MSDPNGWVTNPPTKFVKIHGLTSQPALNGQLGVVVHYLEDSRRYVVVLTRSSPDPQQQPPQQQPQRQRQVSLKGENLAACGMIDTARAQFEILTNNPQVREQVAEVWSRQVRPNLPPPLRASSPRTLAAAAAAIVLLSAYGLGPSRTVLWISFAALAGMLVVPILSTAAANGGGPAGAARRVVPRAQELLGRSGLPLASRVASSPYATGALLVAAVALFANGMLPSAPSPSSGIGRRWFSPSAPASVSTSPLPATQREREHLYKLGFDDALAKHPYGHSLPQAAVADEKAPPERTIDETTLDLSTSEFGGSADRRPPPPTENPPPYYGSAPPARHRKGRRFGMGDLLTLGFAGNTAYKLGVEGGTDGRWTFASFRHNLSHLPPWRLGLLGLSAYRVASIFF
jgi:hypothetical protein